jgi:putative redox protein
MQSCTRYLEGKRFESLIGGLRIVTDEDAPPWGTVAGPTPPELLLARLGACSGHHAVEYLKARSLPVEGLQVYVAAEQDERLRRWPSFRVEVDVRNIDQRQREGVLRAVKTCLIHNTLTMAPVIEVKVSDATTSVVARH